VTTWHKGPMCGFDTETTGVNVEFDRIVTAAVALIRPDQPTDIRSYLLKVDIEIPAEATAVHGITTDDARTNGVPASEALDLIAADLALAVRGGAPIVGMNIAFDLTILDRELRRNGLPTLEDRLGGPVAPVVDVQIIDKAVDPYRRGKRRLPDLCATYSVRIDGAHDSAHDAIAAARVAWRLADRDPRIGGSTLADLHALQVQWRAEQTASFRRYLDRELEQKRVQASRAEPGSEAQAILEQEAAELIKRIDGLDDAWPCRPFPVVTG